MLAGEVCDAPYANRLSFQGKNGMIGKMICFVLISYRQPSVMQKEIPITTSDRNLFYLGFLTVPRKVSEIFYLCTLAPAPPISASTSFLEAIVVSPGVVMASAPCAAP